jgi:hypothetical protein
MARRLWSLHHFGVEELLESRMRTAHGVDDARRPVKIFALALDRPVRWGRRIEIEMA